MSQGPYRQFDMPAQSIFRGCLDATTKLIPALLLMLSTV